MSKEREGAWYRHAAAEARHILLELASESMMGEAAAATGADPLDFRLRHTQDPRARRVMRTARGATIRF